MGWANKLIGWASGNGAEVDANHNLMVRTPQATQRLGGETPQANFVGAYRMFTEVDGGSITGNAILRSPYTSFDGNLSMGLQTPLCTRMFNTTGQNTAKESYNTTTAAAAWGGGFITFSGGTTNGHGANVSTRQYFTLTGNGCLHIEVIGAITAAPVANQVFECGLFPQPAGVAAPSEGVYFRYTSAGLIGVVNSNGTETPTGVLYPAGSVAPNVNAQYKIIIHQRLVEFWINDIYLGSLATPTGNGMPFMTAALPIGLNYRCTGAVTGGMNVKIAGVHADQLDENFGRPANEIACMQGMMASQAQGGATQGSTAVLPNATAATTLSGGALSQTVTIATGLGGQAGLAAAVPGIDGCLFAYQVPAGGVNQTPRTLVINGLRISALNVGAAVVTTPTTVQFSLAYGATGGSIPSLAQAETLNVKAWRRVALGFSTWLVGALVGAQAPDIDVKFACPIVVNPGEWVAIVAKFIQGTATASQVEWVVAEYDAKWV